MPRATIQFLYLQLELFKTSKCSFRVFKAIQKCYALCFFIPATESLKPLWFLFLSMKMLPLVTTRAAARGKMLLGGGGSSERQTVGEAGWNRVTKTWSSRQMLVKGTKAACSLLPTLCCRWWCPAGARWSYVLKNQAWNENHIRTRLQALFPARPLAAQVGS